MTIFTTSQPVRLSTTLGRSSSFLAVAMLGLVTLASCTQNLFGQTNGRPPADNPVRFSADRTESPLLFEGGEGIDQLLTRLALAHLPRQFTDDQKWGMQEEKRRKVRFLNEQGKFDPHAQKQMVNHGTWKRYTVTLRNPETEFQIRLKNIRELPNGNIGFQVNLKGHVDFVAEQVNWKRGVKLFNLTANGHTEVEVELDLELAVEFVGKGLLPDLVLHPRANQAQLSLTEFRIDRIGKIGGEIAQQISREAKKRITEKLPDQEKKIVDKVNQEFSKKEDGYRFSFSDSRESKFKDVISRLLESGG